MKLIGHRAAAGLALENTLEGINMAKSAGVDAIEFDLQRTADDKFVLSHDETLHRISRSRATISREKLTELVKTRLNNGEYLLSFGQAMEAIGNVAVIIDVKGSGWASAIESALKLYSDRGVTIISFDHEELAKFHRLAPHIPTFAVEKTRPLEAIEKAKRNGFTGIDIRFWMLNPVVYLQARRAKLKIIVYTVNTPWVARFMLIWFPEVAITTDTPDRLQFLRHR